jgi:hypothetical protein
MSIVQSVVLDWTNSYIQTPSPEKTPVKNWTRQLEALSHSNKGRQLRVVLERLPEEGLVRGRRQLFL